jgi:hypothetical protein
VWQLGVRLRLDLLRRILGVLLLDQRWLQLLPDGDDHRWVVAGGRVGVLQRAPLLHGLQRHLPVRQRLWGRLGILRPRM